MGRHDNKLRLNYREPLFTYDANVLGGHYLGRLSKMEYGPDVDGAKKYVEKFLYSPGGLTLQKQWDVRKEITGGAAAGSSETWGLAFGLDYARQRWYSASGGGLSEDPYVASAEAGDPGSWRDPEGLILAAPGDVRPQPPYSPCDNPLFRKIFPHVCSSIHARTPPKRDNSKDGGGVKQCPPVPSGPPGVSIDDNIEPGLVIRKTVTHNPGGGGALSAALLFGILSNNYG